MVNTLKDNGILIEELEGDTLTPISVFKKISGNKKFLLESSLKHEKSGRYSFIGASPAFELKANGQTTTLTSTSGDTIYNEKPLELLKKNIPVLSINSDLPFVGGAVGYIGYDVVRSYEDIGGDVRDELEMPDTHLMFFEEVIVFDHLKQKLYLVGVPLLQETSESVLRDRINKRITEITSNRVEGSPMKATLSSFQSSVSKEQFEENVRKAKGNIVNGDIFQVVLSRRLQAKMEGDPFSFYRKLRIQNPSPYMYFLDYEDYVIVGASPESLIKYDGERIITNPIAGTRPRGKTTEEDILLQDELLKDEKELAEHRMLVDLGRNDLGRVCRFGSIKVDKYMEVEKFKHVIHIVSEVSGELLSNKSPIDALISCLPAGTVSGAPKIRAMEIINELEGLKRGVYSGAVGYMSANGKMDFALTIRTMVIKENKAYIQAGAGIVFDSEPEKEFEETSHKLKAFMEESL